MIIVIITRGKKRDAGETKRGEIVDDGGRQLPGQPFFILFIFSLFIPGAPVMRRANVVRRLRRLYLLMGEGLVSLRFSLA